MNVTQPMLGVSWRDDALAQLAEIAGGDRASEAAIRRRVEHATRSLYPFYSTDTGLTLDNRETVIVDLDGGPAEAEIWRHKDWTFGVRWHEAPNQIWSRALLVTFFAAPKRSRAASIQQLRWAAIGD